MISTLIVSLLVPTILIQNPSSVDEALKELDRTLQKRDKIAALQESRIDSLKLCYKNAQNHHELYAACDDIFEEYLEWNPDSAFAYGHLKMNIAFEQDDPALYYDAAADMARRYIFSESYHEAISVIQDIDLSTTEGIRHASTYDDLFYEIYHGLALSTSDNSLRDEYKRLEEEYMQRCIHHPPYTLKYYFRQTKTLINEGNYQAAIEILTEQMKSDNTSYIGRAELNYWMGRVYEAMGDEDNATLYYAISALFDFEAPSKEYMSLIKVAQYCYSQRDFKRAYNYITRSYQDASECNAKLRINQIADIMPNIIREYEIQKQQRYKQLGTTILCFLFALILLFAILTKVSKSHREAKEANRLKEIYLGEYLYMFAEHINSLEKYRSNLRKIAKQSDLNAIQQYLRSDKLIDEEWNFLMMKFDKMFLGLFPEFVSGLNALLIPDKQIGQNLPAGHLTNELRIFALMRLGVTEPARIAKFLRLSSPTVYNYRVKLRNASICKRDEFESSVMKIGQ